MLKESNNSKQNESTSGKAGDILCLISDPQHQTASSLCGEALTFVVMVWRPSQLLCEERSPKNASLHQQPNCKLSCIFITLQTAGTNAKLTLKNLRFAVSRYNYSPNVSDPTAWPLLVVLLHKCSPGGTLLSGFSDQYSADGGVQGAPALPRINDRTKLPKLPKQRAETNKSVRSSFSLETLMSMTELCHSSYSKSAGHNWCFS